MTFTSLAGARIPHGLATTPADPFFDDVVLLLIGDALADRSPLAHTLVNTGVQVVSNKALFGGTSLYFDGASWLEFASHVGLNMSNGDWTVEAWMWLTGAGGSRGGIVAAKARTPDGGFVSSGTGSNVLELGGPLYADRGTSPTLVPTGEWVYLTAEREGVNTRLFINGTEAVAAADLNSGHVFDMGNGGTTIGYGDLGFGAVPSAANQFIQGWCDGLRVTKGRARYIASFTPPTAPFPTR